MADRGKITDFTPDPANANKGTERGLRMLDDSLAQSGLGRSIVTDKNNIIIAGNKTHERAVDQGFEDAIVVPTDGKQLVVVQRTDLDLLNDPDGRARMLAYRDNRVAEIDLDWDAEQLMADAQAGVPVEDLFHGDEWEVLLAGIEQPEAPDENYSRNVESPIYEPSEVKPSIDELYDNSKTMTLIEAIELDESLDQAERDFLVVAAQRHTVLSFSKIADYYAHSSPTIQRLMEDSALVIIDFDRAIELGFVQLTERLADIRRDDYDE
jgi:hypothetical protein